MRALKMSSWQQSEIDNNQLRAIIKDDPLTTKQEVAEKLNINYSMVIWHLKHIGQVKKISISGCLMSWPQIKKIISLKCSLLLFYATTTNYLNWIVVYDEMWILYDNWRWPAQWLDREEPPKHFPRPNLHQPRSWSLFGGLLLVWSTTAFRILAKPLCLRSMLSKLMKCTENCMACSQQWSTERVQSFCTATHDCTPQNHCFKSWTNWVKKSCLTCHIHLTSCHFFKPHDNFLYGKFFHNQ